MAIPTLRGIYESVLYTDDVALLAAFYVDTLGLRLVKPVTSLMAVFRLPDSGVLLIFDRGEAAQPGREVPSHGTHGEGHVAFRIGTGDYDLWKRKLASSGIPIEKEVTWGSAACSIYLRDPAGNSVELVEGEIWPA